MAQFTGGKQPAPVLSQSLLLSVAEQLKLPLLQITRQAELASFADSTDGIADIRYSADMALKLVDSYILAVRLAIEDCELEMEPVSVSSVLYDAGHELSSIAKMYDVKLELKVDGRYGPVMAHRHGLQAALTSLGYALIEALPATGTPQLRLQLSAHKCRYGIVTGLYCEAEQLTAEALRQGKSLYGKARQPMTGFTHSSGAGIFVADAILQAMSTRLKTSRHHKLYGLGALLQPNPQMKLF